MIFEQDSNHHLNVQNQLFIVMEKFGLFVRYHKRRRKCSGSLLAHKRGNVKKLGGTAQECARSEFE